MKHIYYIIGVAALSVSAALTSCSHDDFEYSSATQEATEVYNKAFIEAFGQPAPNQTWGFGDEVAAARMTRGENANANEWADIQNSTGYGGWLVPDTLTTGQKIRVRAYFQANPWITYKDPHWHNFFVQQVYKGGTSVAEGCKTTEKVVAANGSTYDSNNMNHMTVGQNNVHINNFNSGDCSTNGTVLDNGSDILAGKTSYHADKIMLMIDIDDTSCFGYHDSGSSNEIVTINHNDRAALVAAEVIDTWAKAHKDSLTAAGCFGEDVVDKWNRSFLGYDLAIKEGDQIWSGETQTFTSGLNMSYDGIYFDTDSILYLVDEDPEHKADDAHPYGNYDKTTPEGVANVMEDADGNPLKILDSKTNFYSGDRITIDDSYLRIDDHGVLLNMKKVNDNLISQGYYPVSGSAFKEWIRPKHSYDGYYSDWIVTLTKAERIEEPEEETWGDWIRIIAEDLTVKTNTDLDFNDVVFDVRINTTEGKAGTKAEIKLLAAGGTLPLTIGWDKDNTQGIAYQGFEVHGMFGVPISTMVNTNWKTGVSKNPVTRTLTGSFPNANAVKVFVQKQGEWIELTAHKGEPASKLAVGTDFEWCDERQMITDKYSNFTQYVQEGTLTEWWHAVKK